VRRITKSSPNRKKIKIRNSRNRDSRIKESKKRRRVCRTESKDKLIISGKNLIQPIPTSHLLLNLYNFSKNLSSWFSLC
jgi:hypothetical protein